MKSGRREGEGEGRRRKKKRSMRGRRRRRNEEVIMTLDAFITQQRWRGRKVWRWSPLSS